MHGATNLGNTTLFFVRPKPTTPESTRCSGETVTLLISLAFLDMINAKIITFLTLQNTNSRYNKYD